MALTLLTLLAAAGLYTGACAIWPFADCARCHGNNGKRRSPGGKAWRDCPRCKGTGARLRAGRRLYNMLRGPR
jgi:hypothetical protein